MRRVDHPLSVEELTPGSVFDLHDRGRTYKVTVPPGARFGTTLRVGELLVKLVQREAPPVCVHDRVQAVLLADSGVEEMVDLLVRSTSDNLEFAGTCRVRAPADHELDGLDVPADAVWVIDGFTLHHKGQPEQVKVPERDGSPLDWHTHPGLRGGFAGFSKSDERAVEARAQPMTVIGYTTISPQFAGYLAIPLGGWGVVTALGLRAWMEAEARTQQVEPRWLRLGAAARVRFPGGRTLPVRLADAPGWRRALESASFQVDQVMTVASQELDEAKRKLMSSLQQRLMKR
jgi:hypothetical protein